MSEDFLLSMTFTLFGMLLIFGLGFVFPEVNPYVVIRWIVIVCATVFVYTVISFFLRKFGFGKTKEVKKGGKK
ncbi:MAG: hypothetical protein UR52_C0013G0012 [Candidatus Gottesmanbacteria bacterium GW2011_GWA1_34_13]|uniref:Uncharacterized protein n=1 Tax=Candidatus Gottesmanbacteria bacterium GW2011_GWA1_34_13 TaxID=1618434 RepID=A0A0G0AQM4_9BACT|nr:MAG: hypothetical protein UR52_C0013G0012 [Candidatus Gottesmanbacteria bacterium GW2011_GWA1_34_13]